jgi:dolichol-phosphate mannosyltransferase
MDISVIVPMFEEQANVGRLVKEVHGALAGGGLEWELICIDDGSRDGTDAALAAARAAEPRLRTVRHPRRSGQTAALLTGFRLARGELIATLDGDLQNDPADLTHLMDTLRQGRWDMVTGVRVHRHDGPLRRHSSRIANRVRDLVIHDGILDTGCSTRVFRRACLEQIKLFKGLHRFLPALFLMEGFRVKQERVNHRARQAGRSKYGITNRFWRGVCDLLAVRWMQNRSIHVEPLRLVPGERCQAGRRPGKSSRGEPGGPMTGPRPVSRVN